MPVKWATMPSTRCCSREENCPFTLLRNGSGARIDRIKCEASPPAPSRMSGRPSRYALICRYGRPGKPTSRSESGLSPAKRGLYNIIARLSDALNIWLAFKRTTFNVWAFCKAARSPLLSCQAHFLEPRCYISLSYEAKDHSRSLLRLT